MLKKNQVLRWRLRLSIKFNRLISQKEFAEIVKVSKFTVAKWESENFKEEPNIDSCRKVVTGLRPHFPDIAIDDIMPPE